MTDGEKVRQKIWAYRHTPEGLYLTQTEVFALWTSIRADALDLRDPEASINRAVRHLRSEGKTDEQVIDMVSRIMAETLPGRS